MAATIRRYVTYKPFLFMGLAFGVTLLAAEVALVLPRMLEVWQPYDYWQFTQMGQAVLNGQDPAAPGRYYPLPTVLWLFVPLALLPGWFRLVWTLIPFASLLAIFGKKGLILFLFTPLWFALGQGTMDAQLLIPIAWLLADGPLLAPLGALFLVLQPQLALLAIAYLLICWTVRHEWHKVGFTFGGVALLYLPAFLLEPQWPIRFLQVLPLRTAETFDLRPLMTSSLWSWWNLDNPLRVMAVPLLVVTAVLFIRAWQQTANRPAVLIALGLLLGPIFYASSVVAILPALRTTKQMVILTGLSLVAFAVDQAAGTFGGLYTLLPLAGLYWLAPLGSRSSLYTK